MYHKNGLCNRCRLRPSKSSLLTNLSNPSNDENSVRYFHEIYYHCFIRNDENVWNISEISVITIVTLKFLFSGSMFNKSSHFWISHYIVLWIYILWLLFRECHVDRWTIETASTFNFSNQPNFPHVFRNETSHCNFDNKNIDTYILWIYVSFIRNIHGILFLN